MFGRHDWRDPFCTELSRLTGYEIINLDPTKSDYYSNFNENDSKLVFGRDSFLISQADVVIVQLTDDISVGGSQEMLIAKYFAKPLIGIARRNGKFVRDVKVIQGREFHNYIAAFVNVPCDVVVEDIPGAAKTIQNILLKPLDRINLDDILKNAIKHYQTICPREFEALRGKEK